MDYAFTGSLQVGDLVFRSAIPYSQLETNGFIDTKKPALTYERLTGNVNVFVMYSYEKENVLDFVDLIYRENDRHP